MSDKLDIRQLYRIILRHCYKEELNSNDHIENCKAYRAIIGDACYLLQSQSRGQRIKSLTSVQHDNLSKALNKIRQAQHAIAQIPRDLMPDIRREHDLRNGTDFTAETSKALEERGTLTNDELDVIQKRCAMSSELWIDTATQNALSDLYLAIEAQLMTLPAPPKGRKGNLQAQELAKRALIIYERASGLSAGYWNGGETPFTRFVRDLFSYFGIECDLRRPIERAILCRNSEK